LLVCAEKHKAGEKVSIVSNIVKWLDSIKEMICTNYNFPQKSRKHSDSNTVLVYFKAAYGLPIEKIIQLKPAS